jgi:hypothetical protein
MSRDSQRGQGLCFYYALFEVLVEVELAEDVQTSTDAAERKELCALAESEL